MIVCKKCGTQNSDKDSFCTSCGAYLEWSGERVVEEPKPPPPAPPPPPPPPQSFVERVKQAVGMEESTETLPPPPPSAPPPSSPGQGAWTPPAIASSPSPSPPQAPPAAAPAHTPAPATPLTYGYETPESSAPIAPTPVQPPAGPSPVFPQQPSARQPQAVAPAAERPRTPPPIQPQAARPAPGDLICGQCGTGNNPSRHFCQRCGASLAQAVTVKTPWWRRFFGTREAPTAGTRHRVESQSTAGGAGSAFRTGALALIGLIAAGAALGYVAVPSLRSTVNTRVGNAVHDVQRPLCIGTFVPERPAQVTTSAALPGHPAANLTDLINSDYWAAPAVPQPVITIKFAQATDVDFVLVTTGAGGDYANLARPKDIRINYPDGAQEELQLKDDPKATCYGLHGRQEKSAAIRILSSYPSPQSSAVAIAELEFFRFG